MMIRVDYEEAMSQAKQLDTAADKCAEALRSIQKQSGSSESYWVGQGGDAMRSSMAASIKELTGTETQLRNIAASIRRIAGELKRKDELLKSMI